MQQVLHIWVVRYPKMGALLAQNRSKIAHITVTCVLFSGLEIPFIKAQ